MLAGVLLGLAFLSKYFAVFLGLGYVIFYFFARNSYWRHGMVLVLFAIPFGLINLYWNWDNCWSNLLFNMVNRTEAGGFEWQNPLVYLLMMAYVLLPAVLSGLMQVRRQPQMLNSQPIIMLAAYLAATAFIGFLIVSFGKKIGLHWVLWFHPFVLLLLWALPEARWQAIARQIGWFGLGHALLILSILALPLSFWSVKPKLQRDILSAFEGHHVLSMARDIVPELAINPDEELVLATTSYSASSVLSYLISEPVIVIGRGSKYARQDDFLTDFRELDGANVLLYLKNSADFKKAESWFAAYELFQVSYKGIVFDFMLGERFDYKTYHNDVLADIQARFYQFPDWLPKGRCEFVTRYFGGNMAPEYSY
jgi:hypothetical protein